MSFICYNNPSPAVKRYTTGVAMAMSGYLLAVLGTAWFVHHHHPQGAEVYFLAAPPALCILAMLLVVVTYLRDERDEFQRMLFVRSLLWATFATLAISAYNDFLQSYGSPHTLPPFSLFVSFWLIFAVARAVQSSRIKVASND